jgi:hypothetical protein
VIQGDGSSRNDRVISFAAKTEASVDELVGAVWQQTKSWGIAGKGMYWRPEIVVDVQAGGEVRFRDLIVLLDGSGLSVSQAAGAVVGRPPEADPRGRVVR